MKSQILGAMVILTVLGLLVLGLWPFHHPKNRVAWLANANGLQFGPRSTLWSRDAVKMTSSPDDVACSLEVWVQPDAIDDSGTVLAFYDSENAFLFSIRREVTDLVIRKERWEGPYRTVTENIHTDELFLLKRPIFITITSGTYGTALYADGTLIQTFPNFRFSSRDFAGRLVVGDSPVRPESWTGRVRGLAFYWHDLTAAQVFRHYYSWTRTGSPDVAEHENLTALYLFSEHAGNVVHNASGTGGELYIPDRYSIADKIFLEAPWNAFRPTRNYWKDVANNVAGFVPLGLFAVAYLSLTVPNRWVTPGTIALGGAVSLTIESVQVFLPTRDSDLTDVITNTLGTCAGVMLYRWAPVRRGVRATLDTCCSRVRQVRGFIDRTRHGRTVNMG